MEEAVTDAPDEAVERALDLFWQHGYHAVSIRDIVQSTGLNRHTLYARYTNKFGLLTAAIEHYQGVVRERVEAALAEPRSARDRIETLLLLRDCEDEQGYREDRIWSKMLLRGCFSIRMSSELRDNHEGLGVSLDEFGAHVEELVTAVIREGQESGEFRRDRTPEALASVLVSGFLVPLIYNAPAPRTEAFLAILD
jgi:TetR/AcrR family transcriptional repressor of nem operon